MSAHLEEALLSFRVGRASLDLSHRSTADANTGNPPNIRRAARGLPPLVLLLDHIERGRIRLTLPLPARRIGRRPLVLDLRAGHTAIFDVAIRHGNVQFDTTHGRIEPPIVLPLGRRLKGLHLSPEGDILTTFDGLPDLNLSRWAPLIPRLPRRLSALFEFLLALRPGSPGSPAKRGTAAAAAAITLRARGLRVRSELPLTFSEGIHLTLDPSSRIDLDLDSDRHLHIRGALSLSNLDVQRFSARAHRLHADLSLHYDLGAPRSTASLIVRQLTIDELLVDRPTHNKEPPVRLTHIEGSGELRGGSLDNTFSGHFRAGFNLALEQLISAPVLRFDTDDEARAALTTQLVLVPGQALTLTDARVEVSSSTCP